MAYTNIGAVDLVINILGKNKFDLADHNVIAQVGEAARIEILRSEQTAPPPVAAEVVPIVEPKEDVSNGS